MYHTRPLNASAVLAAITLFLFGAIAIAQDEKDEGESRAVAYQVKIMLDNGVTLDGVLRDRKILEKGKANREIDLTELDPDYTITLHYFRGLNGTMGVKVRDLKKLKLLLPLTGDELNDIVGTIRERIERVRAREVLRLAKIREAREARRKQEAEDAKALEAELAKAAKAKEESERYGLLTRYPPEQGWGEEMVKHLKWRGVVIGVFPDDEEQFFLDHYPEWQAQLNAFEEAAVAEADAAKASEGVTGTGKGGKSESGTAPQSGKKNADKKDSDATVTPAEGPKKPSVDVDGDDETDRGRKTVKEPGAKSKTVPPESVPPKNEDADKQGADAPPPVETRPPWEIAEQKPKAEKKIRNQSTKKPAKGSGEPVKKTIPPIQKKEGTKPSKTEDPAKNGHP